MIGKIAAAAATLGLGGLLLVGMLGVGIVGTPTATAPDGDNCPTAGCDTPGWDPGNIITDQVLYNTTAMTVGQVRTFLNEQGADCHSSWCLRTLIVDTPPVPADRYCAAYPGGTGQDAVTVIAGLSAACGVNPQVMLVTLQKESQLLTRTDPTPASYAAAWGWKCPDTGPDGTANCDPAAAGFFNQALGMAKQWSRYRLDPDTYTYRAGQTADIPYNTAETGCGAAPVTIANTATAALYNYTPYQPNQAALDAYPGAGDRCSSYGNRNFYYLFHHYFGPTGGGTPTHSEPPTTDVKVQGLVVTIPAGPDVPVQLAGATLTAPTPAVARGIAAGLATLGMPYVWGGGTNGGPPDQGCQRGGGNLNSCQGLIGLDCSGLTAYTLARAGFTIPTNSAGQRAAGTDIPRGNALPGDIIGYPGHVALYLGHINGTEYLLEAPEPGRNIHIRAAYWTNHRAPADSHLHRYWQ